MGAELLNCPWCGKAPKEYRSFGCFMITCECGANGPSAPAGLDYDEEIAWKREAWNRRTPPQAAQGDDSEIGELIFRINEFGLHNELTNDDLRNNIRPILEDCRGILLRLGQEPTPPRAEVSEGYYLARFPDSSRGYMVWWKADDCGYTNDLDAAGIYTTLTPGYHDSENTVPVPVAFARSLKARKIVDIGDTGNGCAWSPTTLRAGIIAAAIERGVEITAALAGGG